jgi:hypothetical protein
MVIPGGTLRYDYLIPDEQRGVRPNTTHNTAAWPPTRWRP